MTGQTSQTYTKRLIHIGRILDSDGTSKLLLLRETAPNLYVWKKEEKNGLEVETEIFGITIAEAIAKGNRAFKDNYFKCLDCGFRYTLPERDEHGINAYFFQMQASYRTSNGVYFDEILGNNCHVQFASDEAKAYLQKQ